MKSFTFGYICPVTVYSDGTVEERYGSKIIESYKIKTAEGIKLIQKELDEFIKGNAGRLLSAKDWEFEQSEEQLRNKYPKDLHEWFEFEV